jgi:hypothetical protein
MLVPSMTMEEIRREIEKDYPILDRKINHVIHSIKKKLNNYTLKQGFVDFFDYLSKYKNQWLYKLYISQKKVHHSPVIFLNGDKRRAVIAILNNSKLLYHTDHFFERFNERKKLGLKSFKDIVKAYLAETDVLKFEELKEVSPGIFKIFCVIPSGVILGMYNKNANIIKANTFLTSDMLSKNQNTLKEYLQAELEKYRNSR